MLNVDPIRATHTLAISLKMLKDNPFLIFKKLRDEAPVAWVPDIGMWIATRYSDVETILLNPVIFTSETEPSFLESVLEPTMLTKDGKEAKRIKSALKPPHSLTGRARSFFEDEFDTLCDRFIDEMIPLGECDLLDTFAGPVATMSLSTILGLNHIPWKEIWDIRGGLCAGVANFEGNPIEQAKADKAAAVLAKHI